MAQPFSWRKIISPYSINHEGCRNLVNLLSIFICRTNEKIAGLFRATAEEGYFFWFLNMNLSFSFVHMYKVPVSMGIWICSNSRLEEHENADPSQVICHYIPFLWLGYVFNGGNMFLFTGEFSATKYWIRSKTKWYMATLYWSSKKLITFLICLSSNHFTSFLLHIITGLVHVICIRDVLFIVDGFQTFFTWTNNGLWLLRSWANQTRRNNCCWIG